MHAEQEHEHENHERWLVSYADFITLLFAFFVVMFASSQVDKKKVKGIAAAFSSYIKNGEVHEQGVELDEGRSAAAEKTETPAQRELASAKASLERELGKEIAENKLVLSLEPRGLVLSLRESALFPPGRDTFSAEGLPMLAKVAEAIQKLPGQAVRLEGHTDDVPIETAQFPSNWELSAARAMALLELLSGKFQIEPDRLAVAGYAEYHPVADNHTADGRAHNRRVDLVILSRSAAEMEPRQKAAVR